MVASGPFTTSDSLSYQGLKDIIDQAKFDRPQLLILLGPFLDFTNKEIEAGHIFYDDAMTN